MYLRNDKFSKSINEIKYRRTLKNGKIEALLLRMLRTNLKNGLITENSQQKLKEYI